MSRMLRHAVEPRAVHPDHARTALARKPDELSHAPVLPPLVEQDFLHARGILPQPARDRMEAVDEARLVHVLVNRQS